MENKKQKYDLEDRTAKFAEQVIHFVRSIKIDSVNCRLIEQVVGSSGSIGANYCEAIEAESKKDFIHKVSIAKKEIRETKHWLRLIATSNPSHRDNLVILWKEAGELLLIFSKIIRSSKSTV
ncbi:MAG: four helix bundle protein [Candidatus Taylorbacteria bacterium]